MGKTSESHFSEIDHNTHPGLRRVHGLIREVMMASCPRQWFVNGGDPFSSIFIQNIQIIFIIYWNWVYIYIKISYSQTNHNKFLNLALALGSLQRASSSFPVTSKSQPSATRSHRAMLGSPTPFAAAKAKSSFFLPWGFDSDVDDI